MIDVNTKKKLFDEIKNRREFQDGIHGNPTGDTELEIARKAKLSVWSEVCELIGIHEEQTSGKD